MKLYSKIKLKTLIAFIRGRRKSVLIDIFKDETLTDKFIFWIVRNFLKKNSKFEKRWKSDFSDYYTTIFLFRDFNDLRKFDISQKMTFAENPVEKPTLLGEALGYPAFAVDDFAELRKLREKDNDGHPKSGDRIAFNLISYGYDAFIFRPKNFAKMKIWCEENNLPFKKAIFKIRNSEIGGWRNLSGDEIEQILSSKNPEKLASEIAQTLKP